MSRRCKYERDWDLICKGIEAISLLPESPVDEYDFDNENIDDLPDVPKGKLSEIEQDNLMWKSFCEAYKGTKAGEYLEHGLGYYLITFTAGILIFF
jgi:hypothetical protein